MTVNIDSPQLDIGDRLRWYCRVTGQTIEQVARVAGIDPMTVKRWNGDKLPTGHSLIRLYDRCGISSDWLLHDKGEPYADNFKGRAMRNQRGGDGE